MAASPSTCLRRDDIGQLFRLILGSLLCLSVYSAFHPEFPLGQTVGSESVKKTSDVCRLAPPCCSPRRIWVLLHGFHFLCLLKSHRFVQPCCLLLVLVARRSAKRWPFSISSSSAKPPGVGRNSRIEIVCFRKAFTLVGNRFC